MSRFGLGLMRQPVRTGFTTDLVPTMTSATAPSGTVTASSESGAGLAGWKAFDDSSSGAWLTASVATGTLEYEFTTAQRIEQYTLTATSTGLANFATRAPRDWTFQAWNGATWVTLDTQAAVTAWADGVMKSFGSFTNNSAYTRYRVNITANNGAADMGFTEMAMMAGVYS